MAPESLFYLLIGIIILDFLFDRLVEGLNSSRFGDEIPKMLNDVYDEKEYLNSQKYKMINYKFGIISSVFSIILVLCFFILDGFSFLDDFVRANFENEMVVSLVFIGIVFIGKSILNIPFGYYRTFVIESKFGFNKSTKKLFFIDLVKSWLLAIIFGGGVLCLLILFYENTGNMFWIYSWILITVFTLFMTLFYSNLIVPLFNKQTPLPESELKDSIMGFSKKVNFTLKGIFQINGSKRSTKANAYFTGFGPKKRIVLYDTLINSLSKEEVVAVLAHEVGHYKKKHVLINMIVSILTTGFSLFLLSLALEESTLYEALQVEKGFHIGLIAFGILFSPISEITGIIMNYFSRVFEYQADNYAKDNFEGKFLISSLKKLSKNHLSNLTPHPLYVFVNYSHPSLYSRVSNLAD